VISSFLRKRRKILLYTTIVAHVVEFVGCSSYTIPPLFFSPKYLLNFFWSFQSYGEDVCIGRSKEYQKMSSFKLRTDVDSRRDSTNRTVGYCKSKGKLEPTRNVRPSKNTNEIRLTNCGKPFHRKPFHQLTCPT
jgi:hypothetical protein